MRRAFALSFLFLIAPLSLRADAPRVVTDIAPIHSLVAQVMKGIGAPGLLIQPGTSPHGHALRPSEARMLSEAELVIWVGPAQTPWLHEAFSAIAPNARDLALMTSEGTLVLPIRLDAEFHPEEESHDGDHGDGRDGAHSDDHGDGHEEDAENEENDAHDHHGTDDPHTWLDPYNGRIWLGHIANALAELDPANASRYRSNAQSAIGDLEALEAQISAQVAGLKNGYLTFHDAYQYFEARFDLPAAGAMSPSDATNPGPARVSAMRDIVASRGVTCLFSEPQLNPRRVKTLAQDLDLRIGTLDPIGMSIEPGAGLYAALLWGLADSLSACLGP